MKNTIILGLLILVSSCASKKEKASDNFNKVELESVCPEDGKCSIAILENKIVELNTDEFGKLFYTLKEDNTKNILIYKYNRDVPQGLKDGNYREEIIIEIDKKSGLPTNSKTIYGRFCYCKGFTGYYKILEEIEFKLKEDKVFYELQFKIKQVPQIISSLNFCLSIE